MKETMRLAVFTNQFPIQGNTFVYRDVRTLLEAGFDIDVFSFYPLDLTLWHFVPDILREEVFPRNKIHHINFVQSLLSLRPWPLRKATDFLADTAAIAGSAICSGLSPFVKSMYVLPKAWVWAREYRNHYDHVLAYSGNYSATCAYMFHRLIDRPIPFSMFLHAGMDLYDNQAFLRQKLLYADNIIVVCDFNRQFIQKRYPDIYDHISKKIHVYHLGLDFSEFPYETDGRQPRKVLAVGRLDKTKGFDYLFRAASDLSQRGFNYELELIGDGEEEGALKALANQLQIQERVKFTGWLHFDEVRTAMKQATLLVHPSNGLGDAVPTVIKESMALGTPVVASNIVGIPELLDNGRCGMLVPPGNSRLLADAIQTLLTSNELRRSYADKARRYAEETFDLWRNGQWLADRLISTKRGTTQRGDSVFSLAAGDGNEAGSS